MRMRYIILCLAYMFFACFTVTSAEIEFDDVIVDYNRATGNVNISGNVSHVQNAERVRLLVLKPQTNLDELIRGDISFETHGVYADEIALSDGGFTFPTFKLKEMYPIGDYIVRIATGDEVYIDYIPFASIEQASSLINNVNSHEKLAFYIDRYNDVYKLGVDDESIYASFHAEGREYVLNKLCNRTFLSLNELRDDFNRHTIFYKIYLGPWGSIETLITENSKLLSLDMTDFNKLGAKKVEVCKDLSGILFGDVTAFKTAFNVAVKSAKTVASPNHSSGMPRTTKSPSFSLSEEKKTEVRTTEDYQTVEFLDIGNHAWAKDSINLLKSKGIISGKGEGIFAPDDFIIRAEVIKMIVMSLGEVDNSAQCYFNDINADMWMYPYVATAVNRNIITGYGDGKIGVYDNITREDLATIVFRAIKEKGITLDKINHEIIFSDAEDISSYAQEAVKALQMAGVISGVDNNKFFPKNYTTRAEAAKIVIALIA